MRFIYLTGPDGSGKTSFLKEIESHLRDKGRITKHIWLRSPKILSKPLMLYCRLVGLTKYETIEGVKYGSHEFYRSRFVSWLFPILQLIDFKIKNYSVLRNLKSNSDITVLFDRYALDTLADLMVDTGRYNLHKKKIGKDFIKLIPDDTKIVVLKVEEDEIRRRKKDTLHDPHLSEKVKVYNILIKDLNLRSIDNNDSFEIVKEQIFKELLSIPE